MLFIDKNHMVAYIILLILFEVRVYKFGKFYVYEKINLKGREL